MMKLSCKDIDATSACDFETTGETKEEVAGQMMAHAKADHADKVSGMSDADMMGMMASKAHN